MRKLLFELSGGTEQPTQQSSHTYPAVDITEKILIWGRPLCFCSEAHETETQIEHVFFFCPVTKKSFGSTFAIV